MKFSTHQKQPEALWKDFAFELNNYLEGWLHSLEVKDFNSLKDLVLTDQLKKRVAKEVKEHFMDICKTSNHKVLPDVRRNSFYSKINKQIRTVDKAKEEPRKSFRGHSQFESRNSLSCYRCGKPGYIKSKCPDCNPSKGDPAHFGILRINSLSPSNRNAVLRISINKVSGTAFADSGASHSIAGETLYTILLQQEAAFEKTVISLSFADEIVTQEEVLRTFQTVILEGRKFKTPFIILPDAKNNSTLLGVDFLENAGISTSVNVRPVAINNCQLREDEGQELGSQCAELDSLLKNHHSIFEIGGEVIPFLEHSINTENNPPTSVPPFQMNPARKELLNCAKWDTTKITPYLRRLARISSEVRERIEEEQDQRKTLYDKRRRPGPLYLLSSDKVWVTLNHLSNAAHKKTSKFMPKRDGPYIIVTQRSPTTYEVTNPNNPHEVLGPYHSSALRPCIDKEATPVMPLRKRGRPRKENSAGSSSRTIPGNQRGSVTNDKSSLSWPYG
ncbi:retrovirus-related Pol polyprotein from transposon opus [Trichonephila clavipes]|nr:retrovirus-related Pol polyprotein from transposon opus [Trichonephila clavipes]